MAIISKNKKKKNTTLRRKSKKQKNVISAEQQAATPVPEKRNHNNGYELPQARLVYMRLTTGEELITLISTLKEHSDEFAEDVIKHEKNPKIREEILRTVKEEEDAYRSEVPHLSADNDKGVLLLYYPTRVMYMHTQMRGPTLTLMPWISTSITSRQIFRISSSSILSISGIDDELQLYYTAVMKKMMLTAALAVHRKAEENIDPNSGIGKLMIGLKNRQTSQKETEDQEDEYVADMIAKSRKPLSSSDISPSNTNTQTPSSISSTTSNTLPSIIYAGEKKPCTKVLKGT